jgi:hypothetical protein
VLALAVRWSAPPAATAFATPADCLDAYCAACLDGDVARYLSCLAEPLRSEARQRFADPARLAEHLRLSKSGISGWVQHPQAETAASAAVVELEEIGSAKRRLTRFHLKKFGKGWLIVHIDPPEEKPLTFRPGTPVNEAREGSQPVIEP